MKNYFLVLLLLCNTCNLFAQVPQGIPYQSAMRNSSGGILANQNISIRFSLHDSVINGSIVYQETHSTTTNNLGLVSLTIGQGTAATGLFANINWAQHAKFLQVEMAPSGGSTYVDLGTQQMMSVPYALYAEKSGTGFTHWIGEFYGGGVVIDLWKDSLEDEHGLILALNDVDNMTHIWGNSAGVYSGAISEYDGLYNTNVAYTNGVQANSAIALCFNYSYGGFTDWYLPAVYELSIANDSRVRKSLYQFGGTALYVGANYWTSTSQNSYSAIYSFIYTQSTGNGPLPLHGLALMSETSGKATSLFVRPVRRF